MLDEGGLRQIWRSLDDCYGKIDHEKFDEAIDDYAAWTWRHGMSMDQYIAGLEASKKQGALARRPRHGDLQEVLRALDPYILDDNGQPEALPAQGEALSPRGHRNGRRRQRGRHRALATRPFAVGRH